ncbi:GntR family transcriptional regulator [Amycolatopsis sp. QT-25]|uniref:GntR family transcriptional regulator n=1 Tax=Amycolatopsis sp. QT-25 TaxID=3034022 RepID=UPI0023ED6E1D|nr:GntR family transcriptional regulator [Amycolatopsis sp. QT-25]WET76550.1 GntR family transcriptional regulator [Amycolatopsis sp. QT-25]
MPSNPVLADRAYQALRDAIVRGEFRPNQRLVESEVCESIGIGRTPVRGALQMLEDQGMLVKQRQSWTVREFSAADIRDVYETRMALEGYAARLAAHRAGDAELAAVMAVLDEHAHLELLPPEEQVTLNSTFHDAIARASGNDHLIRLIGRNRQFSFDFNAARRWSIEDYRAGHQEHRDIAEALLRRDADGVEDLVREHYRVAMEAFVSQLGRP